MTFEELMKKPELSPDETKKALELASRQTESPSGGSRPLIPAQNS